MDVEIRVGEKAEHPEADRAISLTARKAGKYAWKLTVK